jgi:hypothetical protein
MAKSNVIKTGISKELMRIYDAPSDDPQAEAEGDELFAITGEDPTDDEFDVMVNFKLTHKQKLARLKVLHQKGGMK